MLVAAFRRIPLTVIVLIIIILFLLIKQQGNDILPSIEHSKELASYLKGKIPLKNDSSLTNVQQYQKLPGLLCPTPTPAVCPTPKPIQLECPIPAVQDAPIITGPKSIEQKTIQSLRDQGIVVIFKTGAQEVSQLAIHLGTSLRYFEPDDILFYSDQQGTIGPFVINDALKNVDQKIRETHADFQVYRDIRRYQETGQDITELKEDKSKGNGRGGWRLDKYKFIHMVEDAYFAKPASKWYVFIETDSYVVWPNLVQWLKRMDSTKPLFLGAGLLMGPTYFAHGGSGYVLSNAAMHRLMGPEQPRGLAASWDLKMHSECCGDVALGKALKEQGVKLTQAHPLINGYKPASFTFGPRDHWCRPVVTMHHLVPQEISSVWRFERQRELMGKDLNATTFSELYFHFVEPHITESRDNWDNLSHGPTYTEPEEVREAALRKEEEEEQEEEEKEVAAKKIEEEKKAPEKKPNQDKPEEEEEEEEEESADQKKTDEEKVAENKDQEPGKPQLEQDRPRLDLKMKHMDLVPKGKPMEKSRNKSKTAQSHPKLGKREEKLSPVEREAYKSFEKCGEACEANEDCFQWVWYDKTCRLQTSFRLGNYKAPSEDKKVVFKSGWMLERIDEFTSQNSCTEPVWD